MTDAKGSDYHAVLSPSSAHMWIECAASIAMGADEPNTSSKYADEGTAAHSLAASCLAFECDAAEFVGQEIDVKGRAKYPVDADMAKAVQIYLDHVREQVDIFEKLGLTVEMFVEVEVPIGHLTGEEGATGTSDCIFLCRTPDDKGNILVTLDLKYGQGVPVVAENNPQGKIYTLGARRRFTDIAVDHAVIHIVQPRIPDGISQWDVPMNDLIKWALEVVEPAAKTALYLLEQPARVYPKSYFKPGEKQCKFCRAKARCGALKAYTEDAMARSFDTLEDVAEIGGLDNDILSMVFLRLPLVEQWIKAVAEKVNTLALAGEKLDGIKVIRGRKGSRAWDSADVVESEVKAMRLKHDEIYDYKVKSPTEMEKIMVEKYPRNWKKVASHITQSDGKLMAVPESAKGEAVEVKPINDQFETLE